MKISVIIPAYNEEKRIETCLKNIVTQIEKPFEVIVVDNNCTDKTAEIARKFGAKIVKEKEQGTRSARDAGFNAAKGDIIARTDADTLVPLDWTRKIRESFEQDDALLGLSGPGRYYDIPSFIQYKNWISSMAPQFLRFFMKHDGLLGFNLAIRRETWNLVKKEVCLDDKNIHEDGDLAIHIARHGKVKLDRSMVARTSLRQLKKIEKLYDYLIRRSFQTVSRKRHPRN
ncbi:MAG: glycosyltransferase family A protein [Candidatus Levyibacteriota bacterium]|jgi:glycosyltransferase involved in cell wall biosynthesis